MSVTAFGPMAAAAAGDASRAEGRFLSGSIAGQSFDTVAALEAAVAERKDDEAKVVVSNDLSGKVLGQSLPAQEGGLTIPLDQVVTLGAANQYAEASPRAAARAASGAVSDSGAVNTAKSDEFPASISFSLADVLASNGLPEQLQGQVDLEVALRGLAAVAAHDAEAGDSLAETCGDLSSPSQCRDYDLASADATLSLPAIGALLGTVLDAVEAGDLDTDSVCTTGGSTSGPLPSLPIVGDLGGGAGGGGAELVGSVCSLLDGARASAPVKVEPIGFDASDALDSVTMSATGDGVTVDLRKGTVTIDLAAVVEKATGLKINDLPPNTDLAPYLGQALADLPTLLSSSLTDAVDAITAQLSSGGVRITVGNAAPIEVTGAAAVDALQPILDQVTSGVEAGAEQLSDQFGPLAEQLSAFDQIGSLVVNVQEQPAEGVFREVALRGTLLPGTPGEAVLDLASATVGPGALGGEQPVAQTPVTPVGDPQDGPNLPNTGAGTLDLPFLLLGLGLLTGGMWVVMWGRQEPVAS
ncbi:MAG: choice-of-anchor G family protein [Nocardioidaceae bacterium]|nr:choice-of-anchor G family protein [Nocardioidaceae bacterium]